MATLSTITGLPASTPASKPPPGLTTLGAASFHKTFAVRKALYDANIILAMVPRAAQA